MNELAKRYVRLEQAARDVWVVALPADGRLIKYNNPHVSVVSNRALERLRQALWEQPNE